MTLIVNASRAAGSMRSLPFSAFADPSIVQSETGVSAVDRYAADRAAGRSIIDSFMNAFGNFFSVAGDEYGDYGRAAAIYDAALNRAPEAVHQAAPVAQPTPAPLINDPFLQPIK
jgi:hypothetical protein